MVMHLSQNSLSESQCWRQALRMATDAVSHSPRRAMFPDTWQAGTFDWKGMHGYVYGGCDRYRSSAGRGICAFEW